MRTRVYLMVFAVFSLLAVLVSTGIVQAQTANRGRSNFDWVVARRISITPLGLTVAGETSLFDTTVTGELDVQGPTVLTDLTVANFFEIDAADVLTLTTNGSITATGTLQPIASAGAVALNGGTHIAHVTDYLILVNVGAQTITFTETTGLISAGNIVLGAGDAATLVYRGTSWYQIGASNN